MNSSTLWTWQPITPQEDNHSEYANQGLTLPNGFKIIAARVRGKKHKHEGSNCDDWFEIVRSGNWGIIAVADGAGSKQFSRIGAQVACKTAINYLDKRLRKHKITSRKIWSPETFTRNQKYQFEQPDIELTQKILHEAMYAAYQAIQQDYLKRDHLKSYYKTLGNRDLTFSDFATTLLLVVHTTIYYKSTSYSFGLACQIGDGMATAIYKNQAVTSLLGEVEQNDFCGETEFLTSPKGRLTRSCLAAKTFPFFSPMRALMVMTDGVSDDYFPPSNGMLQLFGDLVLNGVIPITTAAKLNPKEIDKLTNHQAEYVKIEQRIMENGPCLTPICSVLDYAKVMNLSLQELIANPNLLVAGIPQEIKKQYGSTPKTRLQTWLDTYYIRGSFDDRTLVVLFNENT